MEYRSQKAAARVVGLLFALIAPMAVWGQALQFDVRHERALKDHVGRVTFDEQGVEYRQTGKKAKPESARWEYGEIQQLWLSPDKLVIVTYKDRPWLLGIDKEFEFYLTGKEQSFTTAYEFLKGRLDQRFVAALADPKTEAVWQMPAKLQGTLNGSEGVLLVGVDRVIYKTDKPRDSRTWRIEDIENISTSGPFQLTLTTYERAKTHYGSLKGFNFQLKRKLDQKQFDALWKRLNRDKGLEFLTSIQERKHTEQ